MDTPLLPVGIPTKDDNNGKDKPQEESEGVRCFCFTKGADYICGCGGVKNDKNNKPKFPKPRNVWIIRLNFFAAVLHLVLFGVLLGFVVKNEIKLERDLSTKIAVWERVSNTSATCKWSKNCANHVPKPFPITTANDGKFRIYDTDSDYGKLSLAPLVLSFSALSFVFQFARPCLGWGESDYLDEIERRVNWVRWVEYSFSATTMILAVAFVLNIQDVGSVAMLATSTAVTQLFGLVGELMLERKNGSYREDLFVAAWVAHGSAWVLQFGVFFTIFVSYFQSVEQAASNGGESPPAFVYAIVLSMALLFGSFGVVQFFDFIHRTCYDNDMYAKGRESGPLGCRKEKCCGCVAHDTFELAYIGLSLSAKALLSILVAANLFLDMESE